MFYKVFYQETKERSPRREQTRSLYVEVEASSELEGRIKVREWLEETYPKYNIEFIQELKEQHLEYEQTHANFQPERI